MAPRQIYNLARWSDGRVHQLVGGIHFQGTAETARETLGRIGRKQGVRVAVCKVSPTRLAIQVVPRGEEPLALDAFRREFGYIDPCRGRKQPTGPAKPSLVDANRMAMGQQAAEEELPNDWLALSEKLVGTFRRDADEATKEMGRKIREKMLVMDGRRKLKGERDG